MSGDYLQDIVDEAVTTLHRINIEILHIVFSLIEREGIEKTSDMNDFGSYVLPTDVYTQANAGYNEFAEILQRMEKINPDILLPELFLQLKEATEAADMDNLTPAPTMLDVEYVKTVSQAVISQDAELLRKTVEGGYGELVIKLVQVIAMLKFGEELKEINQG